MEVNGLELQWPSRLGVGRLVVSGPRAIVERDKQGGFALTALWDRPKAVSGSPPVNDASESTATPPRIDIGQIAVRNGVLSWRDETVEPRATLDVSEIDATVTGAGWPLRPLGVKLAVRPPGGGRVHVNRFLPIAARLSGRGEADLRISEPLAAGVPTRVSGTIASNRLGVRDVQQELVGAQRVEVNGLELQWPSRLGVGVLLERAESGALPLRPLLASETATPGTDRAANASAPSANGDGRGRAREPAPPRMTTLAAMLTRLVLIVATLALIGGCATVDPWTDTRIESEVKARLVAEHEANLTRLGVVSRQATVYLSGAVESEDQKTKAETVARTVPGVKRVVSTLEVRPGPD
ncbi:MAG: hypothetical protein DMD87_18425 [Candidatus Rokuibacteriota bacterium]|nr:MAG: hypothetical protein DMD87_18425 [Candidatus Rokubacteria bacterium]